MADVKISALPAVAAAAAADARPVVQAGVTMKETNTQVFALLQTTAGLVFTQTVQFAGGIVSITAAGAISTGNLVTGGSVLNADGTGTLGIDAGGSGILLNSGGVKMIIQGSDLEISSLGPGTGLILRSPDNTRYRLTVINGGALDITAA